MACFSPLKGFRSRVKHPVTGKRAFVFNPKDGLIDMPLTLACGQCVGCRLERSRQWAVRCVHEASQHDQNCYITLTYSDDNVPPGGSLSVRDHQLFLKRLRKALRFRRIRFFLCGEYGENTSRPHYHALIFGYDFPDREFWKHNPNGDKLYLSKMLDDLWGKGLTSVGDVTFQSAAYVARYIMKKVTGDEASLYYQVVDAETGEVFDRQPEYVAMSRRGGIGRGWLDRFGPDIFPHDFVVMNNAKFRPPRFYDSLWEQEHPQEFQRVRARRISKGKRHAENNTPERLRVREEVQQARVKRLKREI